MEVINYMANYVYIENNIIKEYYDILPKNWQNISGFDLIEDKDYLKSIGWHQVVKNNVDYDPNSQILKGYDYKFENDQVYENAIFESFTPMPIIDKIIIPKISAMQLRLWFFKNNISTSDVEKFINLIENESIRQELMIRWEYTSFFERDSNYINDMGNYLGFDPEQIDKVFLEASKYN